MRALKLHIQPEAAAKASLSRHALKGHSGAGVILYTQGLNSFVRKTAASEQSDARLKSQADKQHRLWMLGLPFPKVLAQGADESGRAYFDMAYIPGRTIADAVADAASFDAGLVAKSVERMVWLFATAAGAALSARLFEDKVADVVRRSSAYDGDLRRDIDACARRLMACDWSGIPESPCHGDLTLENILLTSGKSIAFIDCDDSFASSYWVDFGKLFQDIDGHWCIRQLYAAELPAVRRVNAVQKLQQLGAHFRSLAAAADPALPARLPQLAGLSLFRAIPYARNSASVAFLCRRILHVLGAEE